MLVAEGLNVVLVSRQLGHASPDITLRVYSHLFDQAEHGKRASEALGKFPFYPRSLVTAMPDMP